ncbi:AMP-binding protein [Streptomyces massasporeus]|uniref:acyl carrier protein n=1 Tax=Streptomyces massasporeus TaxID=67324 RepID=UPI0036F6D831
MNGDAQRTLHGLVERQALRAPDAIAVTQGNESLSYRELNRRADQFARHLLARNVLPESTVGLRMTRSLELIVAMLGVLKSGAAFTVLPFPDTRERGTSQDARRSEIPDVTCDSAEVAASWEPEVSRPGDSARPGGTVRVAGDPGAGALTVPVHEHDGLVEVLVAEIGALAAGPGDAILQRSPVHEPCAVFEIFLALSAGAGLYLMDDADDESDAESVVDALTLYHATHVRLAPELLTAALSLSSMGAFRFLRAGLSLKAVWSTTDVFDSALHARLRERFDFRLRQVQLNDAPAPGQTTTGLGAVETSLPDTSAGVGTQHAPTVPRRPADAVAEGSGATLSLVTQLWSEILNRPEVTGEDDFFAIGGNSLTAVLMSEELGERLGREIPVSILFEHRTAAALARVVHIAS